MPESASAARRFVQDRCVEWGVPELRETAVLLASELVTNGVLHARTDLAVATRLRHDALLVEVEDHDPRPPVRRSERADLLADIDALLARDLGERPDVDERHALMRVGPAGSIGAGRGLLLVEALADEWGVSLRAGGKKVWFRLAVPDSNAGYGRCTCPASD